MRELTALEIEMVNGAGALTFIRNSFIGGVIYDGIKSASSWVSSTFFARDGSGGSRYPIEQCEQCS